MPSISPEMSASLEEFTTHAELPQITRKSIKSHREHKNHDLYKLTDRSYDKQFASLYYNRLKALRPRVSHNATRKWGKEAIQGKKVVKKEKVLDIKPDEPSWVIGTVYIEMKYKPDILQEVGKGEIQDDFEGLKNYSDADLDTIMLEDESGRVLLEGELTKETILVTGAVIGVLGMEVRPGYFKVVDIVYPLHSAQKPTRESEGKVALVSGLNFDGNLGFKQELLTDFFTGELGYDSSDINKLIIVGDSVNVKRLTDDEAKKYGAKHKSNYSKTSIEQLDSFLSQLLTTIPIDIMPGEKDPVEISLPQQELHRSFFPSCQTQLTSGELSRLTNPSWLQINELRLLGTSGENINDVYKYLNTDKISRLSMIESTLHWQNIIPTAPDTLSCYPFKDKDPFTLMETPHVYFVGNQPTFETGITKLDKVSVRTISIPVFSETGQIVILDTKTLEVELVTIE